MRFAGKRGYAEKKKAPATVVTLDGERIEGHFFVFGYERLTDALNRDEPFIAFECTQGISRLLKRDSIARVIPREIDKSSGAAG
jgi:hypothetical protein